MGDLKFFKFLIKGKVQGVGYRAFVYKIAKRYQLKGSARNLIDGGVEVIFEMPDDLLAEVNESLKKGSPLSKVVSIDSEEVSVQKLSGFSIL